MEMLERIGEPAMLEQTAEEATELAQAALKLARILRDENPTPVTLEDAKANLAEEYTDVVTCARELGLRPDEDIIKKKQQRFLDRWGEATKPIDIFLFSKKDAIDIVEAMNKEIDKRHPVRYRTMPDDEDELKDYQPDAVVFMRKSFGSSKFRRIVNAMYRRESFDIYMYNEFTRAVAKVTWQDINGYWH